MKPNKVAPLMTNSFPAQSINFSSIIAHAPNTHSITYGQHKKNPPEVCNHTNFMMKFSLFWT